MYLNIEILLLALSSLIKVLIAYELALGMFIYLRNRFLVPFVSSSAILLVFRGGKRYSFTTNLRRKYFMKVKTKV